MSKKETCKGCIYYRRYSGINVYGCHYMYYNGKQKTCFDEICMEKDTNKENLKEAIKEMRMPGTRYYGEEKGQVGFYDISNVNDTIRRFTRDGRRKPAE